MPDPAPAAAPASAPAPAPASAPTPAPAPAPAAPTPAPANPAPAATTTPASASGEPPKAGDPAATPAPVVPEKYDLKAPEGSALDAAHLEAVASFAKENGLSQDAAQKLIERDHATVTAVHERAKADWSAKIQSWGEATKADQEIGGDKLPASIQAAQKARDRFGSDALKKILDETGAGNHPEFVRFFARVGQAMSEDKFTSPTSGGTGQSQEDSLRARYPSMYNT